MALARALALAPEVLLLDEPFSALDALTREHFDLELLRLGEQAATTIVMVTHSIAEAILVADRVVVLTPRPGRVSADIAVDAPRPRTIEVLDGGVAAGHRRRDPLAPGARVMRRGVVLPVVGALVVFVLAWKAIVVVGGYPPFILPPPETVFGRFVEAWGDGTIEPHLAATMVEVALGLIVGAGLGLAGRLRPRRGARSSSGSSRRTSSRPRRRRSSRWRRCSRCGSGRVSSARS